MVVHGWVYGLHNGLIDDLKDDGGEPADVAAAYGFAGRDQDPRRDWRRTANPERLRAMFPPAHRFARLRHRPGAMLEGFNRHYRLFRETSAQAKRRFEQADWHGQQRASAKRIEFYDKRVDGRPSGCRREFQAGSAADGRVAAGQAALHRPAHQPPPARAG